MSSNILKDLPKFRANSAIISKALLGDIDTIDERTLGLHALNPFIHCISSPRGYMMSSHLSQVVPLLFGDEKITLSGVESQLAQNTFSIKAEADFRVIKIIPRYNVIGGVDKITSKLVIVQNIETHQLDYIDVPSHFQLHQTFGFQYKWSDELKNLYPNDIVIKDTILADSPTVRPNNGYAFGVNANMALMSIPEVSEDGVIISKSLAERLSYDIFEKRVIEYDGNNKFPLNVYGDENNYKPFPAIGDLVNQDSIVMCLRKVDKLTVLSTLSNRDLMDYDPQFDIPTYVRGPGETITTNIGGKEIIENTGVVVDVKVYHNPKSKKETINSVDETVKSYALALKKFYKDVIETVNVVSDNHKHAYKHNIPMSPKLKRFMLDAYAITNENNNKIKLNHRNEVLDTVRIEITVKHRIQVSISSKISDLSGSFLSYV